MENNYYDGTKLLSMKDIDGNTPEIYMCTTNRTGGKTTWFNRYFCNCYFKRAEKFGLIYRYNYELDDVADKFYKDVGSLFFPRTTMTSKKRAKGIFHELYIDDKPCGYALSLNAADSIKKHSHLFSDIQRLLFDEFQSETNHYCADEVTKLLSVHKSIARGQGKQYRRVPIYMIGNPVSIINPYYVEMGISTRLTEDTKFLRGSGFVLEQGYVESADKASEESGVLKAFSQNEYVAYSGQGVYLNDSKAFIQKPANCTGKYIATIRYKGTDFAIREYRDLGILYCDDRPDRSYPNRISVTTEDHNINYVMLKNNDFFIANLRYFFERGCFRFKDLRCKEALLKCISY